MRDRAVAPYFDADAYLAGLERPTVRIGNITFRGRLLSIEEWLPFEELLAAIADAANGEPTAQASADMHEFAEKYLRAVFPREDIPWYLRRRDPVPALLKLPWAGLLELLKSFLAAQRRSMTPARRTDAGPSSSA